MQDQEIADLVEFVAAAAVVFLALRRAVAVLREQADQPVHVALDEMDAGRFERLEKAARQTDRRAIVRPESFAPAGGEPDGARIGEGLRFEAAHQHVGSFVVRHEIAAIDMPVPGAVLQRDAPLPACAFGGGAGVGREVGKPLARHRLRAVAGQPTAPVAIARAQRLAQEQRAKSGAVDEEIALDLALAFEPDRLDVAALSIALYRHHHAFGADYAALFGVGAQVSRIEPGVEVVGVGEPGHRRVPDPVELAELSQVGGAAVQRVMPQVVRMAGGSGAVPVMMELHSCQVEAGVAESVQVAGAHRAPVDKFDAEFERAVGVFEEVEFVDAQHAVEPQDLRDSGLSHADRADGVGFDKFDRQRLAQQAGEGCRRYPACSPAADDHQFAKSVAIHRSGPPEKCIYGKTALARIRRERGRIVDNSRMQQVAAIEHRFVVPALYRVNALEMGRTVGDVTRRRKPGAAYVGFQRRSIARIRIVRQLFQPGRLVTEEGRAAVFRLMEVEHHGELFRIGPVDMREALDRQQVMGRGGDDGIPRLDCPTAG